MTLKNKLTLVLAALAVAPLLLVGWLGYRQALRGVEAAAEDQLNSEASGIARDLARTLDEVRGEVEEAAASPEVVGALEAPVRARGGTSPGPEAVRSGPLLDRYPALEGLLAAGGGIELRDAQGSPVHRAPASTLRAGRLDRCAATRPGDEVRMSAPVVGRDGALLGELVYRNTVASLMPASTHCHPVEGGSRSLFLLDRDARSVVYGPAEEGVVAPALEMLDRASRPPGSGAGSDSAAARHRYGERIYAYADVPGEPWAVVATAGLEGFEGPLRESWSSFVLAVLVLAGAVAVVARLVVGRMLRPLQEVTVAADRIGKEELVPWLPPPGDDEIGRLALSVNRMADRVERRLRHVEHSSRMEIVQDLAAYLCDKMRDPLSSIRLSLQALERERRTESEDGDGDDTGEVLRTSLAEISRLDGLVSSVAKLGSSRPAVVRPCSIRRTIHEAAALLESDFVRDRIRFRAYLHEGPDTVPADPGQLKNVFLQLFLNSVHAVSDGGLIEIRTGIAEVEEGKVAVARIRDDGAGVDPAERDRIFEPFFTTRADAAGLGLAIALRAIRTFGGDLELVEGTSARGGAEFSLILPLVESPSTRKIFRRPPGFTDGILAANAWTTEA